MSYAVSASAFEHHRAQCLEAGADDFVAKPFRMETLLDLLCRHLGLEPVYGEEADAARSANAPEAADLDTATAPPPAVIAELLDLARRGSIRRLLERASRLDADGRHGAFTEEIRKLAGGFQLKQLCQFLEAAHASPANAMRRGA